MELTVSNMSCDHCKMTIEKVLKEAGVTQFKVDVPTKTVTIESNEVTEAQAKTLIESKGYEVK